MEFDFLPKLPSSNLDDRTFDDLVEDCLLRIPRYCPEWTDHNLSDPGITLIELFAWLTDQMLLRFNQVPRKNYVAFLELLGVRLQAPAPAQTELTFYLSTSLAEVYTIPTGVEVATLRTENTEAIVFSTDRDLIIGKPSLRHLLSSQTVEDVPQALRERGTQVWTRQTDGAWTGSEQSLFEEQPQPGNCFYLAIDSEGPIDGNVLAVTFQGNSATPTGIDPKQPPRDWEAWDGENWVSVLYSEVDDATKGWSFYEIAQQGRNPSQGAQVMLHLPQNFPVETFTTYRGRWLRCKLTELTRGQTGYNRSPRIIGMGVKSIGGTIKASHSTPIRDERLGISNGKAGQTFELQTTPILARREDEYIIVVPPGGLPQRWQEVNDFADSSAEDRHYTLDSLTGIVQFGPLILEPSQLQRQKNLRAKVQHPQIGDTIVQASDIASQNLEYQYGAVPPSGSEIRILAYRTGGGREGNVQKGTLQFLKAAVPYVAKAINHQAATNGADGESLEQAVLRAPKTLRTRDRAVTAEDFEVLSRQSVPGAVARTRCLPATSIDSAGTVSLLIVPSANIESIELGMGISPDRFSLTSGLRQQILGYLDERRLLGIQVRLQEPEYVGVSVQTEIALEPAYENPLAQQEILSNLRIALYKYLNPLTGGIDGRGWEFGRPLYSSDIVALVQKTPGVRYLGAVLLFPIRNQGGTWTRLSSPEPLIDPGIHGLICSWVDNRLRSSHVINIINR